MEERSQPEVNLSKTSAEVRARVEDPTKSGERSDDALALAETEESLHRAVVSHGPSSERTRGVALYLVLAYNHFAMKKLSENNIKVRSCCTAVCTMRRHQIDADCSVQ